MVVVGWVGGEANPAVCHATQPPIDFILPMFNTFLDPLVMLMECCCQCVCAAGVSGSSCGHTVGL